APVATSPRRMESNGFSTRTNNFASAVSRAIRPTGHVFAILPDGISYRSVRSRPVTASSPSGVNWQRAYADRSEGSFVTSLPLVAAQTTRTSGAIAAATYLPSGEKVRPGVVKKLTD